MDSVDSAVRKSLIMSVGTHRNRRPLSPIEVAEALERMVTDGMSPRAVADAIHLEDPTMVTRFRRLLRLTPRIRHLVDWGRNPSSLSLTTASEIARIEMADDQETIARATLEHRLSSGEIRQVAQILDRSKESVPAAINSVLRLRPQVTKRYIFIGDVISGDLRSQLTDLTQQERDHLLRLVLNKWYPTLPQWSGRLGPNRFTLVGDEDLALALRKVEGGFERVVNACLESEGKEK